MYAIIEVGAKQYNVEKGDIIEVEKMEAVKGKDIIFENVLLACKDDALEIGSPYVKGASVKAELICQDKAKKVVTYKYRRRKAFHFKKGHRQQVTRLKITDIKL